MTNSWKVNQAMSFESVARPGVGAEGLEGESNRVPVVEGGHPNKVIRLRGGRRLRPEEMLPGQYERLMVSLDEIAAEHCPTRPIPVRRPLVRAGLLRVLGVLLIFLGGLVGVLGATAGVYNGVTLLAVLLIVCGAVAGWFGFPDADR